MAQLRERCALTKLRRGPARVGSTDEPRIHGRGPGAATSRRELFPCRGGDRRREIARRCASQTTPGISETLSRTDRQKRFIDSGMPLDQPFFPEDVYDSSVSGGSEALRERGIVQNPLDLHRQVGRVARADKMSRAGPALWPLK